MYTYHKIQTVFLRDPATKHRTVMEGRFARPEFGYLADSTWAFTEKVDGTNVRLIRTSTDGPAGVVRGKTDAASLYPGLLDHCQEIADSWAFGELPEGMTLYGEGYGAKIQKGGGNYRDDQGFVLFDVWAPSDDGGGIWLERESVEDIAGKLGIQAVPIIGTGTLWEMVNRCRSGGLTSTWGDFDAEGIVARPTVELRDRCGRRVITKLKCRDFS